MKSICVFLGANVGNNTLFSESVILLGHEIAERGARLVYGGSSLGMMGLLATTVKERGGAVVGVITRHLLEQEKPLEGLDELHLVDTLQERKNRMEQESDLFVVMPGGLGTLEEAFEIWNAIKIGVVKKPIGFLNTDGYFDKLFSFITDCKDSCFISEDNLSIPKISSDVKLLLKSLDQ